MEEPGSTRWQKEWRLWPDWWRLQLPFDDCCRLVLPYHVVEHATDGITNKLSQMETTINTLNNQPSTRLSSSASLTWQDLRLPRMYELTSPGFFTRRRSPCKRLTTSVVLLQLAYCASMECRRHIITHMINICLSLFYLAHGFIYILFDEMKAISQSVSSQICSSLVLHTSACWSSLNRGLN